MRKNLGVPDEDIRNGLKGSVFLTNEGDFQDKKKFNDLADDLMSIYGIWYERPDMISARWVGGAMGTRRLPKVFEILKKYGFDMPQGARSIAQRVANSPTPPRPVTPPTQPQERTGPLFSICATNPADNFLAPPEFEAASALMMR